MLNLRIHKSADNFLKKIPAKHAGQIVRKIALLREDQDGIESTELNGFAPFRRCKSGEYRVIYLIENGTLHITIIGKRNDGEVYKQLKRFMR